MFKHYQVLKILHELEKNMCNLTDSETRSTITRQIYDAATIIKDQHVSQVPEWMNTVCSYPLQAVEILVLARTVVNLLERDLHQHQDLFENSRTKDLNGTYVNIVNKKLTLVQDKRVEQKKIVPINLSQPHLSQIINILDNIGQHLPMPDPEANVVGFHLIAFAMFLTLKHPQFNNSFISAFLGSLEELTKKLLESKASHSLNEEIKAFYSKEKVFFKLIEIINALLMKEGRRLYSANQENLLLIVLERLLPRISPDAQTRPPTATQEEFFSCILVFKRLDTFYMNGHIYGEYRLLF